MFEMIYNRFAKKSFYLLFSVTSRSEIRYKPESLTRLLKNNISPKVSTIFFQILVKFYRFEIKYGSSGPLLSLCQKLLRVHNLKKWIKGAPAIDI